MIGGCVTKRLLIASVLLASFLAGIAQSAVGIPHQLQGKWRVRRIIPTRTITCWDQHQADQLLGSVIEYSQAVFRRKNQTVPNPHATSKTMSAKEFSDEFYGGPNDSQVDFKQLGIHTPNITIINIDHPDSHVAGPGSVGIPGDEVLLESENRIIITVCNVYFEADRVAASAKP